MKQVVVFLVSILMFGGAFGATKVDGEAFRKVYHVDDKEELGVCGGDTEWEAVDLGESKEYYDNNVKDRQYVYMLVARELVENGGKFCETLISAKRDSSASRPYTVYYDVPNGGRCYWMCKDGLYGEGCKFKRPTSCVSDFSWDKYKEYLGQDGSINKSDGVSVHNHLKMNNVGDSIEEDIPMLYSNRYFQCNGGTKKERDFKNMVGYKQQEHDVIVGIVAQRSEGWYRSAPVFVRAGGTRNQVSFPNAAWPVVFYYPNDDVAVDLVLDGYKNNGVNYFTMDGSVCNVGRLCPSTPAEKYDSTQHEIHEYKKEDEKETTDCASYFRCKSGAFASKTDFKCVECGGVKNGQAQDGTCLRCPTGKYYHKASKTCKDANSIPKTSLRTTSDSEGKPCWLKDNPDDYKECIFGN